MSLRRSARSRLPTDEEVSDIKPNVSTAADAARKRKRASDEGLNHGRRASTHRSPEAAAKTHNTEPDHDAPSGQGSASPSASTTASTKPTSRPRGRPPKNAIAAQMGATTASSSPEKVNGHQSPVETRRSTRGIATAGAPSTISAVSNHLVSPGKATDGTASSHSAGELSTSATSSSGLFGAALDLAAGALPLEDELNLAVTDAEKLRIVIECFAPELLTTSLPAESHFSALGSTLLKSKAKGKAKSEQPINLGEALDGRPISLRQLRAYLLCLQSAYLPVNEVVDGQQGESRDKNLTLLLGLVDEIAVNRRLHDSSAQQVVARDLKEEHGAEALDSLLDGTAERQGSLATTKYALHMRLPGGDFFTKAVELSDDDVANLRTGVADLIRVEPSTAAARSTSTNRSTRVPTLGERLYRKYSKQTQKRSVEDLRERHLAKLVPISSLYYGPFASFAPSYDSSAASLSRAATSAIWSSKTDSTAKAVRKAWSAPSELDEGEQSTLSPPPPLDEETGRCEEDEEKLAKSLEPFLDDQQIQNLIGRVDRDAQIDKRLDECAARIVKLQALQDRRLRASFAHRYQLQSALGRGDRHSSAADDATDVEREAARSVLSSLADLLRLRPRSTISQPPPVVPSDSDLQALSQSAAIDPAFATSNNSVAGETGYWGTLDLALHAPEAGAALAGKVNTVVPMFASNETARLDPPGEQRAINRSLRQRNVPIGVSRDYGRGLLDRIAESDTSKRGVGAALTLNGIDGVLQPPHPPQSTTAPPFGHMGPPSMGPAPGPGMTPPGYPMHGSPPFIPMHPPGMGVPMGAAGSPPLPAAALPTPKTRSYAQNLPSPRPGAHGAFGTPGSYLTSPQHQHQQQQRMGAASPIATSPMPGKLHRYPSQQ